MSPLTELEAFKKQLPGFIKRIRSDDEDEVDDEDDCVSDSQDRHKRNPQGKKLAKFLRNICKVVRRVAGTSDFDAVILEAEKIIADTLLVGSTVEGLLEALPSFAHTKENPMADNGRPKEGFLGQGDRDALIPFLRQWVGADPLSNMLSNPFLRGPDPWPSTLRPHPLSSRISRFAKPDFVVTPMPANTTASMIYTARCEATSNSICSPARLNLSAGGQCLVLSSAGGWKNRAPVVQYYHLEGTTDSDSLPRGRNVKTGLADIVYNTVISESKRLIVAADEDRVKTFAWGPEGALPVHTIDSDDHQGPLALLDNGNKLVRAGSGSMAVWNLDELPTHGDDGKGVIGGEISLEDTWRDDPEDIETSEGVPAIMNVDFEEQGLTPLVWFPHPGGAAGQMISSLDRSKGSFSLVALDLEHSGKVMSRYIGHSGDVLHISTSVGDPNTFATDCDDGLARLWDIREPFPVLTFDVEYLTEARCGGVALAHPDGIPTLFTGATKRAEIRLWDIRARSVVYDLATGNNGVASLAWDHAQNALYAATECYYIDRLGRNHDYRSAKIPKAMRYNPEEGEEDVMDDDDDDEYEGGDDSDEDDEDMCWPRMAYHGEDYFGYAFNAGEHRIYRYQFKANPDVQALPPYGDATMGGDYW